MTEARGHAAKTALTPREKLKVAYFYLVRGIAQQELADIFEVNQGRINEAIDDVRKAVKWNDHD
ncbi:MAG: hypothetical protein C5B60_07810 [Chloroflexi bacterium]|nr:MAG: hypothetical protein C5B60_07810 [Chloroflexota bacterium]